MSMVHHNSITHENIHHQRIQLQMNSKRVKNIQTEALPVSSRCTSGSKISVRFRGGPVDVDSEEFVDVDPHMENKNFMVAQHLKNQEYNNVLEVLTKFLHLQVHQYSNNPMNKHVASTWYNIGIIYSRK